MPLSSVPDRFTASISCSILFSSRALSVSRDSPEENADTTRKYPPAARDRSTMRNVLTNIFHENLIGFLPLYSSRR